MNFLITMFKQLNKERSFETSQKVDEIIAKLKNEENVSIISHGFNYHLLFKKENKNINLELIPLCFTDNKEQRTKIILKNANDQDENEILKILL